tara:strand:+ start:825 stop:1406 length:582 start_codon:yes stop_codon:yes gene_type:complete
MTKKCINCNVHLPKTDDFFFKRVEKNILADGSIKTYTSFRSNCKKCHSKKGNQRRIKLRCEEMNCEVSEYRKKWKKQYTETRTKDKEAKEKLNNSAYIYYKRLLKLGEVKDLLSYFYRIESQNRRRSKSKIKITSYNYIKDYRNKYYKKDREKLKDAYITNGLMGLKVSEVPKEIIETKRLIIKIKREIKNGK